MKLDRPYSFFENEDVLNSRMDEYYDFIRGCLRHFEEVVAEALLDILVERAGDEIRKDGITPFTRHQCDQAMYTFAMIGHYKDLNENVPLHDPMAVVRLNIGHDHLEDLFESEAELIHDLRTRLGVSYGSDTDKLIRTTVAEIRIMSKKFKGQKEDECSDYEFHWRVAHNANTSIARLCDTIHNSSTKSRIPKKTITEQAEDADRVSRLILHPSYPGRDGQLKRFRTIAEDCFEEQSPVYEAMTLKILELISIERGFHELHPAAQRPHKTTGIPIPNPDLMKPLIGFERLPEVIEPSHVLAKHIREAHPMLPFMSALPHFRDGNPMDLGLSSNDYG